MANNITAEDVRSRAEACFRTLLDSCTHHNRKLNDYLDEQRRAAHMTGFIIGFSDAEIDEHFMRHMKGAECNDHD